MSRVRPILAVSAGIMLVFAAFPAVTGAAASLHYEDDSRFVWAAAYAESGAYVAATVQASTEFGGSVYFEYWSPGADGPTYLGQGSSVIGDGLAITATVDVSTPNGEFVGQVTLDFAMQPDGEVTPVGDWSGSNRTNGTYTIEGTFQQLTGSGLVLLPDQTSIAIPLAAGTHQISRVFMTNPTADVSQGTYIDVTAEWRGVPRVLLAGQLQNGSSWVTAFVQDATGWYDGSGRAATFTKKLLSVSLDLWRRGTVGDTSPSGSLQMSMALAATGDGSRSIAQDGRTTTTRTVSNLSLTGALLLTTLDGTLTLSSDLAVVDAAITTITVRTSNPKGPRG